MQGSKQPLHSSKTVGMWDGSQLYWFDELPTDLRFNPDVRSGYRAGTGLIRDAAAWQQRASA